MDVGSLELLFPLGSTCYRWAEAASKLAATGLSGVARAVVVFLSLTSCVRLDLHMNEANCTRIAHGCVRRVG